MIAVGAHASYIENIDIFETKNWLFVPCAKRFKGFELIKKIKGKISERIDVKIGVNSEVFFLFD